MSVLCRGADVLERPVDGGPGDPERGLERRHGLARVVQGSHLAGLVAGEGGRPADGLAAVSARLAGGGRPDRTGPALPSLAPAPNSQGPRTPGVLT